MKKRLTKDIIEQYKKGAEAGKYLGQQIAHRIILELIKEIEIQNEIMKKMRHNLDNTIHPKEVERIKGMKIEEIIELKHENKRLGFDLRQCQWKASAITAGFRKLRDAAREFTDPEADLRECACYKVMSEGKCCHCEFAEALIESRELITEK
jgi:hypothetical protein